MTLDQLLPADAFALLLVFVRLGAALMLLPGFGEIYVMPRTRLLFALALTIVIAPLVAPSLPRLPADPWQLALIVGGEAVIGVFFGTLARILVSGLHIGGTIIGFQSSLANATLFDPANAQQGSLVGTFLGVFGVVLVFAANLDHLMLSALADSYTLFVPGAALPWGDLSQMVTRTVAHAFAIGMQIAAPFIVVGLVFSLGLGLLNRLMPQIQVFFVALPLQLGLTFLVMVLMLSAGMMWFLADFQNAISGLTI